MRLVKVKRNQQEKTIGNLRLVFSVLNVCEATKENECTTLDFYQIFNVTEVWDLEAVEVEE